MLMKIIQIVISHPICQFWWTSIYRWIGNWISYLRHLVLSYLDENWLNKRHSTECIVTGVQIDDSANIIVIALCSVNLWCRNNCLGPRINRMGGDVAVLEILQVECIWQLHMKINELCHSYTNKHYFVVSNLFQIV